MATACATITTPGMAAARCVSRLLAAQKGSALPAVAGTSVTPSTILSFWFGPTPAPLAAETAAAATEADTAAATAWFFDNCANKQGLWWGGAEQDGPIREAFGPTLDAFESSPADFAPWMEEPRDGLALVVLLDQLSRNIHRGSAKAFSFDAQARVVVHSLLDRKRHLELRPVERAVLFMPLEHHEDLDSHRLFGEVMAQTLDECKESGASEMAQAIEQGIGFQREHAEVLEQFGRYPHRNKVLGRESTSAEREYLESGGKSWGQ